MSSVPYPVASVSVRPRPIANFLLNSSEAKNTIGFYSINKMSDKENITFHVEALQNYLKYFINDVHHFALSDSHVYYNDNSWNFV